MFVFRWVNERIGDFDKEWLDRLGFVVGISGLFIFMYRMYLLAESTQFVHNKAQEPKQFACVHFMKNCAAYAPETSDYRCVGLASHQTNVWPGEWLEDYLSFVDERTY
jgi:hypothetical protein